MRTLVTLNDIMLSVILLRVYVMNVVTLSGMAPLALLLPEMSKNEIKTKMTKKE